MAILSDAFLFTLQEKGIYGITDDCDQHDVKDTAYRIQGSSQTVYSLRRQSDADTSG